MVSVDPVAVVVTVIWDGTRGRGDDEADEHPAAGLGPGGEPPGGVGQEMPAGEVEDGELAAGRQGGDGGVRTGKTPAPSTLTVDDEPGVAPPVGYTWA
jgi:hypothetical protein